MTISKEQIQIRPSYVVFESNQPLKILSSALHNAGFGWYNTCINRAVDANYMCEDAHTEMKEYIEKQGFQPDQTVAMMTAVAARYAIIREFEADGIHVVIMVTAGVGNAVDVSKTYLRKPFYEVGTINIWAFIDATLTEEAFVQAMMTATEAKVKALADEKIADRISNTIATGTSTDSILIGATQQGTTQNYAGTVTPVGRILGKGVYETVVDALHDYKRAKGMME
ncbi:iron ABC transporter permease [Kurthia gibsonii]|uniref:adenosylcobinamide amidohydrolase n=1 Tax=Kurthia gibsonii TaxID=33946 RepID=UPI000B3EEDCA|nr:adenosylcobinamide amidohydrolase [Kurthia gibsonii]RXH51021.1 iron ABC transporter permease [Kurthia gibsonii]